MSQEIDDKLAAEELSPLSEIEQALADKCIAALEPAQRLKLTQVDIITTIRGYQTYVPREEETIKAFKAICKWRDDSDYCSFLRKRLANDELFYKYWPEYVYGADKYGHQVIGTEFNHIDTDKMLEMDQDALLILAGQKMTSLLHYKQERAAENKEQRYKHNFVINIEGLGMALLGGSKGSFIKRLIGVSGNFFPESVWKIYVVNAPFLFRAVWTVVKPWVHPITVAKVNIFGSPKDAIKKMIENGLAPDQVPEFAGGTRRGVPVFDILQGQIAKHGSQEPVATGVPWPELYPSGPK